MPRMFSAIEVPDDVRAEINRLHNPLPGARWIHPGNYHITLRYLGDIERAQARDFIALLEEQEPEPFEVRIASVGAFGGHDPSTVFAAVEATPALEALARLHEKLARHVGFSPAKRPFRPHVTLARLKHSDPKPVARFLTRYGGYRSEPFFVARTVLFSSRPVTGGGPYATEAIFPMRGCGFAYDDHDSGSAW